MQMTLLALLIPRLRDERGFTLIEALVAMISGVIVVGALVLLLEVTINQTSRITETSQANQLGRVTMTKIIDELHSTCLAQGFTPIQEVSTEQKLRFITAYSENSVIPSSAASEHEILFSKPGETLTDKTYAATSGEGSSFAFPTTATSTVRIGAQITPGTPSGKEAPVFRYYRYAKAGAGGSSETPESALEELKPTSETTALGETAKEVAAVIVTFKAGVPREELLRSETKAKASIPTELSDQVTFAFAAPESEGTIEDSPCH